MGRVARLGQGFAGLAAVFFVPEAQAYIGPGAGLGAIAITVALVLGILLLLIGLVWYPLKRLMKGKKRDAAGNDEGHADRIE